jgi:hypothetical protein
MQTVDERIKAIIRCPIAWSDVSKIEDFEPRWLLLDWYASLTKFAVSSDEAAIFSDMAEFEDLLINDENDLDTLKNIEWRMPEATALYRAKSGRLSSLEFLKPSTQGKHFRPGLSVSQILKLSKRGPSLFFRDISQLELKIAFWTWFDGFFWTSLGLDDFIEMKSDKDDEAQFHVWNCFMTDHQKRIAVNARTIIGASNGEATSRVCFDLHLDSRTVHAYPVSELESTDIMQGGWVRGDESFSDPSVLR